MSVPAVHHWLAGDEFNATRMNEVANAIEWLRNPPMVHVARRSTGQAITANAWNLLSFDTLYNSYDPYGIWDVGNPGYLTFTEAGWYTCELQFSAAISVDSRLIIGLFKNGTGAGDALFRYDQTTLPSGSNVNIRKEGSLFFNVGDSVYYGIYCDATAITTAVLSDAETCSLRVRWVSN